MLSADVIMISLRELGDSVMHGTEVHSSIGGKVVKFMHGASGPQREGWQLSTCPAIRGHSFSDESPPPDAARDAIEMAMGSRLFMGGELLTESEAESVVVVVVRSELVMLESSSAREPLLW